jgi:hypothetical protein
MKYTLATAVAVLSASSLFADNDAAEAVLKRFFEGKSIVARIDLPATSAGVDVYPERESPLDYSKVADRTRTNGVAVREGGSIVVTKVKVKDDLIEFQLGSGGFNWFKDTSPAVTTYVPKSGLEKDLERRVKDETDSRRRRELQRELDDVRRDREADEARQRRRAEIENARIREADRERALDLGSRFNIRFDKKDVPLAYLSPEGVMRALGKYVDFRGLGPRPPARAEDLRLERPGSRPEPAGGNDAVQKGMRRSEVEEACGRALREDRSQEGALRVRVAAYKCDGQRLEVTFVDDVAVKVTELDR